MTEEILKFDILLSKPSPIFSWVTQGGPGE